MSRFKKFVFIIFVCCFCFGCSSSGSSGSIDYVGAKELIINNGAYLVDVRTSDEYNSNHINGAINIPLDEIKNNVSNVIKDSDSYIIVYCKSGSRSHEAYDILLNMGYKNVYDLGSIDNWKE